MVMIYLVPVWGDTTGDDMNMIVGRIVMGIDKQWLTFFGIPPFLLDIDEQSPLTVLWYIHLHDRISPDGIVAVVCVY